MKLLIRIIACLELLIGIIQMIVQISSYSRMAAGYGLTLSQILFQEGAIAEVTPKIVIALGFFGVLMALSAFIDGSCKLFGTKETTAGAYGNITADEEGEDDDEKDDELNPTVNSLSAESYSVHMSDGSVREFALSLQDRIAALETLVNDAYSESDNCWYTTIVYDKHVVMIDCWSGKAYRQEYKVRSDVYSLVGDRVSVHGIYVTDDEEKTLNELRGKFESAQEELNRYHKIEEDSEKKSIYASDEYRSIFDKAEYAEVNLDDYSVDELRNHLDGILLKYAKEGSLDFSVAEKEETESTVKVFGIPSKKTRKGRYGSIFSKKN